MPCGDLNGYLLAQLLQSGLILCDPVDCCPPGSSVHGILQARILEWVAKPSSRGSSQPKDGTCVCLLHWQGSSLSLVSPGKCSLNGKEVQTWGDTCIHVADSRCTVETSNTVEQLSSNNRNFQKEYLCPHKILNMKAYDSFAYDCLNLEATQMFFKRGMNKEIVVHPCNGISFRD